MLLVLAEAAPAVVTQDELVERVWNGRVVSPETVTQRVKLLRAALGDDASQPRYIALVRARATR
ncbi:MAG: winged helix-turn-helix domain-containing protein [Woeseiaceae bacterium]|nr:winged helix-turn-helix domain-containing protein [Woeseiaceae bacterium]